MTTYDPAHHRRSIRLPDYDYTSDGGYFVTICAHQRVSLFGDIVDGDMQLNELGRIVESEWLQTVTARPYVILDDFVVMPNHFHGILFITKTDDQSTTDGTTQHVDNSVGAQRAAPLQPTPHVVPHSLGAIIRGFKSAVTKRINDQRGMSCTRVWQRNYYEHVIRNESALNDIRSYIQTNPARWAEDDENPANVLRIRTEQA